jgi:hypothetical protein
MVQAGRSWVRNPLRSIFSIYLIPPAELGPGVHSAFNGNEYQKQKNVSGSKVRPVLTAISEPIV